jgi:hypothetical protein
MGLVRSLKGCASGLLVLGLASALHAEQPQRSFAGTGVAPPSALGSLLYGQTDSPGAQATNSQNFEAANDAFDNELADDFVVPAAGWGINEVQVQGLYFNGTGPAPTVHVRFYSNSGTLPGALVAGCDYPAVVPADTAGSFTLTLAPVCNLTAGTYWVSVVANMNFTPSGQWGWQDRAVTTNSPAAWRNPGGGFGVPGCLAFGARGATCGIDAAAPDQIFSLFGQVLPVELQSFSAE